MSISIYADAARIFEQLDMSTECWLWDGYTDRDGYGQVSVGSRTDGTYHRPRLHRWVYEYIVGPIPKGLQIDHLCNVRHCANPAHLEPVTLEVNQGRKRKRREPEVFCMSGRHLMEIHAKEYPSGKRSCRTCALEQRNARYQMKKGG